MTDQSNDDGVSSKALDRLLLEQAWLEMRPGWNTDSEERKIQILISSHYPLADSIDAIRTYVACVSKGITPPAATLSSIGASLQRYLESAGRISLDDAFRLRRKQRSGHRLTQKLEYERRSEFAYAMWHLREKAKSQNKPISIETAAGQVIEYLGLQLTEETLKKHYIAIDADSIFSAARDAIDDAGRK